MRFSFKDGDRGFVGIDMTHERDQLEPGMLARGENTRLRNGRASQRRGTSMPTDFNPVAGFGNFLIGSGVFNDPNGDSQLMLAPSGTAYTWHVKYAKDPVKVEFSTTTNAATSQTTGAGKVTFAQAFEKVLMLRRPALNSENIIWNGATPSSDANRWQKTVKSAEGLAIVPGHYNAESFNDRVLFYNGNAPSSGVRDTWVASDILEPADYDYPYQEIRTNAAESDFITRIFGYFRKSVIVFKSQSIHQVEFFNTLPLQYSQRELTSTLGSLGTNIPVEVGGDVFFWSPPHGFFRLSEIIQDQIVSLPISISEQIQDVVDAINVAVTAVHGCSAVFDKYVLFGVAIGAGAKACNAVLVYDTQTRQWVSSPDTWRDPNFYFNALHVIEYFGAKRVVAVDYLNSTIYLLYEGVNDELLSGQWSVPFKIETRGYNGGDPVMWKRFYRTKIAISTSAPAIRLTAIAEGFNEEKLLTPVPIEKDRLKYYTHGTAAFDPLTDDPEAAKREDYSLESFDNFAYEDFEGLPDGEITMLPGSSPLVVGDQQQSLESYVTRQSGRWQSIRIENDQGSCEVLAVSVEGNPTKDTNRVAA